MIGAPAAERTPACGRRRRSCRGCPRSRRSALAGPVCNTRAEIVGAVERPTQAGLETMRALAPGTDDRGRPIGLKARHLDQRKTEYVRDFSGDCGEHLGRRRSAGDERRHPAQGVLLRREDASRSRSTCSARRRSSMSVKGHDRATALRHRDRDRRVGDREHRSGAAKEPVELARARLAGCSRQQHGALGRGIRSAVRVLVVDRLVTLAPEQLVGVVIAERVGKPDRPSGSTTQIGWAAARNTAARNLRADLPATTRSVTDATHAPRIPSRRQRPARPSASRLGGDHQPAVLDFGRAARG
jgi:hypothetical protein